MAETRLNLADQALINALMLRYLAPTDHEWNRLVEDILPDLLARANRRHRLMGQLVMAAEKLLRARSAAGTEAATLRGDAEYIIRRALADVARVRLGAAWERLQQKETAHETRRCHG